MFNAKIIFFAVLFLILSSTHAQTTWDSQHYQDGVIYLKIKNSSLVELNIPSAIGSPEENAIHQTLQNYQVSKVEKPFEVYNTAVFDRIYKVYFPQVNDISNLMSDLNSFSFVEKTERVPLHRTSETIPNDPLLPYQLPLVNAFDAFDLHQGGNVIIAIVDDAVHTTHEDLEDNIIDGYDFANNDQDPNPPFEDGTVSPNYFSHGTHVAGIAGAVSNNSTGIASISWNAKIMPIRATNFPNQITHGPQGVAWAASKGADIINIGGLPFHLK